MNKAGKLGSFLVAGAVALGTSGCIKKVLLDGQIKSTRTASAAVNTISDYEVAKAAAMAGLAQFEGMHFLGPDNEDALFLLTRSWSATGFGFIEDELEQAEDLYGEDSELAEYHKARAVAAYNRAIFYGTKVLEKRHAGFEDAKKNQDTMKAWVAQFTSAEDDAPFLFWTAQAWLSKVNLLKDDSAVVGELHVGVKMIERAVELDETYNKGSGHVVLGSYHARTSMAELDDAKKHFERAIELTKGSNLLAKYNYASKYFCNKSHDGTEAADKEGYVKLLDEVVAAGDLDPEQRLPNTIAKRRARRFLSPERMKQCGFKIEAPAAATAPAAAGDDDDKDEDDKDGED